MDEFAIKILKFAIILEKEIFSLNFEDATT